MEADCLPVLLELIVQTNRSQAALVVVAGIIRILTNIARVRFEHLPGYTAGFHSEICLRWGHKQGISSKGGKEVHVHVHIHCTCSL